MKLLVLTSRIPYPLDKGDKLRAYHQLKYLAQKHDVLLCSLGDAKKEDIEHLKTICQVKTFKLNKLGMLINLFFGLFSNKPYQVKFFYQYKIYKKLRKQISEFKPDHIFCQLIRCAEYVKNYHDIPKTLDYMDAFSKGMERRIEHSNFLMKPFVRAEHKRLLRYENLMFEYFENKTIISEQDRGFIFHKNRKNIYIVSNGVDVDYFSLKSTQKIFDVVFVGNLNYPPNVNACLYIVNKILPLLSANTKVLLSGATPSQQVQNLASNQVEVRAWVEDIRESYASGEVFVAPMFTGTGLQNKLLEAMAMQLPCITTPLVNTALLAEDKKEVIIALDEHQFAEGIKALLSDEVKKDNLAINGREFVQENYSWDAFNQKLDNIITVQNS